MHRDSMQQLALNLASCYGFCKLPLYTSQHLIQYSCFRMTLFVVQVVATGTALLARLKLYAVIAQATEVAEQLVKAHVGHASQMGMQQVSKLINTLSTHLMDLSEELLKSDSPALRTITAAGLAWKQGASLLLWHCPCWQLLGCVTALYNAKPFCWFCFASAQC